MNLEAAQVKKQLRKDFESGVALKISPWIRYIPVVFSTSLLCSGLDHFLVILLVFLTISSVIAKRWGPKCFKPSRTSLNGIVRMNHDKLTISNQYLMMFFEFDMSAMVTLLTQMLSNSECSKVQIF